MKRNVTLLKTVKPIAQRIIKLLDHGPVTVMIGAAAHSGKSRLTERIKEELILEDIPVTTLSNDLWLRGVNRLPHTTTAETTILDMVMANVDADKFVGTILRLQAGKVVRPPVYNPKTRMHVSDKGEPLSFKEGVLVLDGAVVLAMERLREVSSLNIYVEIPDEIRLEWIHQCSLGFKGLSTDETWRNILNGQKGEELVAKASVEYANLIYQPASERLPRVVRCDHK